MNFTSQLSVVVLAAGKGTRMKSAKAKVLHEVFYRPMLHHVLEAVQPMRPLRTIVIVGHEEEAVRKSLGSYHVETVLQERQLGTGHAVLMTKEAIPEDDCTVMILCGDTPLITPKSLRDMFNYHLREDADITVMTTELDDPYGYGRIISSGNKVIAIVEEKEADGIQKKIREVNSGIYLVNKKLLFEALETVNPDNAQGEFYLTDIVEYLVNKKKEARKFLNIRPMEVLGVNSRAELEVAHRELQEKRNIELMHKGVTIHNSRTVTVGPFAEVGVDTLLMQNAHITGKTVIGESCIIENGAILNDCHLGDNVRIGAYSVLSDCTIEGGGKIAPATITWGS